MSNNMNIYDELFAYRISLLDNTSSEIEIIKELKYYLLDLGISNDNINITLYDFYQSFDIDVSYDMIQDTHYMNPTQLVNDIVQILNIPLVLHPNNIPEEDEDNINMLPNMVFADNPIDFNGMNNIHEPMINFLNILINGVNNGPIVPQSDVKVTTDQSDVDKLKIITLENKLDDDCAICMGNMDKDEIIVEFLCKHMFHKDCIMQDIDELHNKCPVCRHEIGKATYKYD